jgi:two-component system, NtrC family, sensor histidine kinase GlrK
VLYEHFVNAGKEFAESLAQAERIADALGSSEILKNIEKSHARYRALVQEEERYISSGKPYRVNTYKAEKNSSIDTLIKEIKKLEVATTASTRAGIEALSRAGTRALRTAMIMALCSLFLGVIIAWSVTRSITKPLSIIKKKTREIARGKFENPLAISSPPEIEELAHALNVMSEQLAETEKIKSDFFALMTHELRTPLASMKAGLTLLQKHPERSGNEVQKILAIMAEECNRLIQQVNTLLDLSKIEAGVGDFDLASHDIRPLLKKAVEEIEPLYASRDIFFEFDYNGTIPPIRIDPEKMLQVIRNILGNAVKYSPDGCRITISLRPAQGGLEFAVTDAGPGISGEDRAAIFDKYRQANAAARSGIKGTGLGLALAKHIVDIHGGRIWVESEPGKGSTFTVFLRH